MNLTGLRKVLMVGMGLFSFVFLIMFAGIRDVGGIVAVGTQISIIVGSGIYGNKKEHESKDKKDEVK